MFDVVHVATDLGLRPGGVADGGRVLVGLGLDRRLGAGSVTTLVAPSFEARKDEEWGVPNLAAAAALARRQADVVQDVVAKGRIPVVLGGDDSVLFGCLLAIRRIHAAPGLVFLDGHTDFWDPRRGDGELSDSDLFIASGRGPTVLADLEGLGPLVRDEHCVVYGHRDRDEHMANGSDDVYATRMLVRGLAELRAAGMTAAGDHARAWLAHLGPRSVWVHLDADCLDDAVMPAVDWRLPGGLGTGETLTLLRPLFGAGLVAGMDVTIYNPALDTPDRQAGRVLSDLLVALLRAPVDDTGSLDELAAPLRHGGP
jgi:arginase